MQSANESGCASSSDDEKNYELYALVWLDQNIDSIAEKTQNQQKLRSTVNTVRIYRDVDVFKQWMKRREGRDERVILVTSECTGRQILSEIGDYKQLTAIYIYDAVQETSEHWSKDYPKICSTKTTLDEAINQIIEDQTARQKVDDASFFPFSNILTEPGRSSCYLNGDFLQTQRFIEVLLRMEHQTTDLNEMIEFCKNKAGYKGNKVQLKIIEEFSLNYSPENALRWYTRDSCFYRLLNQALRTQDVSTLIAFRPFIHDLHVQLKQLQSDADPTSISRVYRGQVMSRDELDELKAFIGKFVSLNSFLSTSLDPETALGFTAGVETTEGELHPVLFEIDIPPSIQNTKPFANISLSSNMLVEDEVLFMLGSSFKICSITKNDTKWIVVLQLASESDDQLNLLLEYVNKDVDEKSDFVSLGTVLFDMGRYDDAKICFERKLDQLNKAESSPILAPQFADCYESLGKTAGKLKNYDLAIEHFQKQLELCESGPLHIVGPLMVKAYMNMAKTCIAKGDTINAAIYNENAEALQKKVSYDDGIYRAENLLHSGSNYFDQELYEDALNNYNQALSIFEQCLSSNDYHIAIALQQIGRVYQELLQFEIALEYYLRADRIYSESLTSTHDFVSEVRDRVKDVTYQIFRQNVEVYYDSAHYCMQNDQFEDALGYYKEAVLILKERFSSNHYVIAEAIMNIVRTYAEIAKQHFAPIETHPGMIRVRVRDQENIIEYLSQAKQILSQHVAPTHPDMLFIYGASELSQSFLSYQDRNVNE